MTKEINGIYISKPWEKISSRKGDPLGFQGIANQIADEIAPGLSGRNTDARWLTLLCIGLSQFDSSVKNNSYKIFSRWERCIVKWAIKLKLENGRQLPGKRSVDSWPNRYRYYGPYGSYKKMLINIGLIEDDGWTLTQTGRELAKTMGNEVTPDFKSSINVQNCVKSPNKKPIEKIIKECLPLTVDEPVTPPEKEILAQLVFGGDKEGQIRRNTFRWMKKKRNFWQQKKEGISGSLCEAFQEFTCSCFAMVKEVSDLLSSAPDKQNFSTCDNWKDVLQNAQRMNKLKEEALSNGWSLVVELARQIIETKNPCVLLDHHISSSGSGKKWLALINGKYESLVSEKEMMRKSYSFRLWNIWRLGRQLIPDKGPEEYPWYIDYIEEDLKG